MFRFVAMFPGSISLWRVHSWPLVDQVFPLATGGDLLSEPPCNTVSKHRIKTKYRGGIWNALRPQV